MKTASRAKIEHPVEAGADAAGRDLAEHHVHERDARRRAA